MTTLAMAEVLDLSQLAQVLEDFSGATGLATVAVDARGIPVTPPCAFTDFCQQMRSDPARNKLCHGCDAHGGLQSLIEGAPKLYRCHSGLVDFSVPVTEGDRYVGAILCGQVRVPGADQPDFLIAPTAWQGEEALEERYQQVTVSSLRKVRSAATTLLGLSRTIGRSRAGRVTELLQAAQSEPQLPHLTLVPVDDVVTPTTAPPPPLDAAQERLTLLRDAMNAEDLATAFVVTTRVLDEVHALHADHVRDGLAELEDVLLEVARHCAPRLVPHLSGMVQRQRERRTSSPNRYQSQLYAERILGIMLDEIMRCRPHRRRDLRDLLNDIARRPNRALSLTEAAAFTHWSPGYLSKMFKSVTGCTFVSYLMQWRISRAKLMLASTQMPVRKIAAELDFNQVNYFSRVFRAHTGHTPSEYRRQTSREERAFDASLSTHHDAVLRA